ncbi:MAG: hypothetical protein IPJ65_21535 [Archangiaceae bacterium]|nr:hypothetical protein [Archangiaceae bacterium]
MTQRRRLLLSAFTATSCSSPMSMVDAGVDGGYDAGPARDAGVADAGRDAGVADAGHDGGAPDAGCRCANADGGCRVPADFPPALKGTFYEFNLCSCEPNEVVFCAYETDLRCPDWGCDVAKRDDGGARLDVDGGPYCLC